jgi:hypothetical protein
LKQQKFLQTSNVITKLEEDLEKMEMGEFLEGGDQSGFSPIQLK